VFRTTVLHYDVAQCRPKGEYEARESTGLLASAVLTPLLGKLGARNVLGNWAAQIMTFEGAFLRVPWTLQNRAIRGAAISFRGARPPPRNSSTASLTVAKLRKLQSSKRTRRQRKTEMALF